MSPSTWPVSLSWPGVMPLMLTTGTTPPITVGNCTRPSLASSSSLSGMSEAPKSTVLALDLLDAGARADRLVVDRARRSPCCRHRPTWRRSAPGRSRRRRSCPGRWRASAATEARAGDEQPRGEVRAFMVRPFESCRRTADVAMHRRTLRDIDRHDAARERDSRLASHDRNRPPVQAACRRVAVGIRTSRPSTQPTSPNALTHDRVPPPAARRRLLVRSTRLRPSRPRPSPAAPARCRTAGSAPGPRRRARARPRPALGQTAGSPASPRPAARRTLISVCGNSVDAVEQRGERAARRARRPAAPCSALTMPSPVVCLSSASRWPEPSPPSCQPRATSSSST